jgi:hypothetical protein
MSYQKRELRVLSGSLNLLTPPDKIAPTDSSQLENFRLDQAGALVGRAPVYNLASFGSGGDITTIGAVSPAQVYVGLGGSVYRYPSGSVVTSGLTGKPFGFAAMNGFAWIMDQNVQGRDDGTTFTSGVPNPPAQAPILQTLGSPFSQANALGLQGTYQYYVTFVTAIGETNPSPPSNSETFTTPLYPGLTNIPTSADPTVTARNIYRIGGVLGQPYLVGTLNDNTTTTFTDTMSDVEAAAQGVALEFDHDPPPAAQGLAGPYFGRLLAFCTAANPNRMWWTKPGQPAYWPGASLAAGQWVDIGESGEKILAITCHARFAVIYKERSIWRLIGDPDTGYIEIGNPKVGIFGPNAVANAGAVDYFAGTSGGYRGIFTTPDGVTVTKLSTKVDPIFQGGQTWPAPGGAHVPTQPLDYGRLTQCALEFAGSQVFFSYPEFQTPGTGNTCTLVMNIDTGDIGTLRIQNALGSYAPGFTALYYSGDQIWGGTGNWMARIDAELALETSNAPDMLGEQIAYIFQSRAEDAGYPDNQKVFLDMAIDWTYPFGVAEVYAVTDNGTAKTLVGTLTATSGLRVKATLSLDELRCTNLAIRIEAQGGVGLQIHGLYLYYYVDARLADTIETVPFQLAPGGQVVQLKELQVDADATNGPLNVTLYSDMPGNELAVRATAQVPTSTGRRPYQLPVPLVEGRLFQFLASAAAGAFRLYGARALIRVIGTYIEGYEAAAGFVWDSMEEDFSTGITHIPRGYAISLYANPIKRAREIALQMESTGPVTVALLSDLPGDTQAVRASFTVNTGAPETTVYGRREVRLPLPAGLNQEIEGRMFRLQVSGNNQFKLYEAAVEILPIGVYVEAYEAAGGAVYDSREIDWGTPKVKEAREIEIDIDTAGATATLLTDMPSGVTATVWTAAISTSGREHVMLALPLIEGRVFRLVLTSANSFKLYGARIFARVFGQYLTGGEGTSGAFWDTTELDLGTQAVKQIREIELDVWAYGTATVTVYTDLPGNAMAQRQSFTFGPCPTRRQVRIPLQQGAVPENYLFGRLVRVTIASPQSVKLFGARIHARPVGVYVEGYEALAGAVWDSTTLDLGSPAVKQIDEIRFERDTDGPVQVALWTDLPGEAFAVRYIGTVAASAVARSWATIPVPGNVEGRSLRLLVSGPSGFRLYKGQIRARAVGRYIAAQNAGDYQDALVTSEFDFGSERVKLFKKIWVDIETDGLGSVTVTVLTDQSGSMGAIYTATLATNGVRKSYKLYLPLNARGRLMRIQIGGPTAAIVYHVRVWTREANQTGAQWAWRDYPVEPSGVLPEWTDVPMEPTPPQFDWAQLPVEPTPPEWSWMPLPVNPTEPQWQWAKILSVAETSDSWTWVDLPGTRDPAVSAE